MNTLPPAQPPKKSGLRSGCLIAAGLVGGLAVLGAIFGDNTQHPSAPAANSGVQAEAPAAAAVPANARQIFAAYQDNQIAAAKLYEGKRLAVSGTVQKIDESFGLPVIELATANQFMPLRAKFARDAADALAALHPGAKLAVVCDRLNEAGGFLSLEGCQLK